MSPADNRRLNPKQQNNYNRMNLTTNPTCLSLRNNAACCIPLCVICVICGRIHIQTYSINIHRRNPNVSRRSRRFTQTNNKQQTTKQPLPQTNCLSLRNNAACCIPLRDLRNLRENNTQEDSINPHKRNPNVSRRSRWFTQTKPQNHINYNMSFSAK